MATDATNAMGAKIERRILSSEGFGVYERERIVKMCVQKQSNEAGEVTRLVPRPSRLAEYLPTSALVCE